MINKCSQQLLAILGVPLAAAKALVRAGLRVQITSQQLVARAYKGFEGLGVWLEAFSAAGVPLVAWTAELPAELRPVCRGSSAFSDQLVQDLTPARTADLLAVALNVAASSSSAVDSVRYMFRQPAYAATAQLPAAVVETLLRLAVQLHGSPSNKATAAGWQDIINGFCQLPAVAQLPTETVVGLAQQAVLSAGDNSVLCAAPLFWVLVGRALTAEQVKGLLTLLLGPPETALVCGLISLPDGRSVMAWLASQPGAAAAAAGLGLTAADVQDPAAVALLFGGQAAAATGTADDPICIF
ncbi:hypothetical protein OEZ85_004622 [Tetradesmus obliquus]|uniref:Uncharacterized protein n=1 Tax=Tetradesmus obliquus TaxID=3088 RepID=A0ABY8UPU8_TETOB|nr:hypothetical protein OEZ85_004622 [Tetradesmus obliquus]